jgi:hypothetical protein
VYVAVKVHEGRCPRLVVQKFLTSLRFRGIPVIPITPVTGSHN